MLTRMNRHESGTTRCRARRGLAAARVLLAAVAGLALGCSGLVPGGDDEKLPDPTLTKVTVDRHYLKDAYGRYVYLRGINVGGTNKIPVKPGPAEDPLSLPVSYVGRPFPIEDADTWFGRIKNEFGFNSIRLVIMWEAVEPVERGQYDTAFLDYVEQLVKKANDAGIYVLVNFHENLFSRFFNSRFTRNPVSGEPGSIERMLATLFPDPKTMEYDGRITGDGAPRWAVEACVPEKNLAAPTWGMSPLIGPLGDLWLGLQIFTYVDKLLGMLGGIGGMIGDPKEGDPEPEEEPAVTFEDFLLEMIEKLKSHDPPLTPFEVTETCDVYPFTNWWTNVEVSYDIERCYAAFYAGDAVYPSYTFTVDGKEMNIKDYLQDAYVGSWVEVAKRVKKYPNVIGYDLVNEPPGGFLVLMLAAVYINGNFNPDVVEGFLVDLVGPDIGETLYRTLFLLNILPFIPSHEYFDQYIAGHQGQYNTFKKNEAALCQDVDDADKEACFKEGFYQDFVERYKELYRFNDMETMGVLDLNFSFVVKLVDLYRKAGVAILEEDPDAVIWLEEGGGMFDALLGGAIGSVNLYKPEELRQIVFSPHWYPDIYPYLGFNEPPRDFVVEEWMVADFTPDLEAKIEASTETFGPVPVVFGEFGTYFNYNGIEQSLKDDYRISNEILDNYYESFESLFAHTMLWCLSADNSYENGDGWNYEDFSIVDPEGKPRGEKSWGRPYPRFLSGKPKSLRFHSDFHYYDPDKGTPDPLHEFELAFESKETDMPTEIFVPEFQYPDGFYVWLSDGWAKYVSKTHTLYFYPTNDQPGWVHSVTIRMPQDGAQMEGWSYFFKGEQTLTGDRH